MRMRWSNIVIMACILQTSLQARPELELSSENGFGSDEGFNQNPSDQDRSEGADPSTEIDDSWADPENKFEFKLENRFDQKRTYPLTSSFIRKLWGECYGTKKSFCHRGFATSDSWPTAKKSLWMTRLRRDQDQGTWMTRLRRSGREQLAQEWMARLKKDDASKNWMTRMRRLAGAITANELSDDETSDHMDATF